MEHENPMDIHFNSNDVEVFHDEEISHNSEAEVVEVTEPAKASEEEAKEPVMDVWQVEEESVAPEFSSKSLPFLAVLRNTVEENERMSQQLLQRYRSLAEQEYKDDYTCNSDHL